MSAIALIVFCILFAFIVVLGFWASRWRKGDLSLLDEWGLAGRRFGTIISWFLIGGDLYTAYTFIAVPALAFGKGAIAFFAVPYTIVVYPFVFVVMPRLWSVCKKKGYITASDFVRGRFESQGLGLAVAITGILATMPYIALQLVGMEVVLQTLGITGPGILNDLPLIIAFAFLAAFTYTSGLRGPASVAIVKDALIYITIIAAIIVIPAKLGGFGHIFQVAAASNKTGGGGFVLSPGLFTAYATLALGSALALFFYPHAITGVLSSQSRAVIRKTSAILPLYSLLLGFITLLGFMALAAGIHTNNSQLAVPLLLKQMFPPWLEGFSFAAIVIGALVPSAIMSIAAANMFVRNIWKAYVNPNMTPKQESTAAKNVSLLVKVGALVFVIFLPLAYAINLQLLGGVWILQTVPMLVGGLYTRWMHRTALLIGWLVGMVYGTLLAVQNGFQSSISTQHLFGSPVSMYAGAWAIILNLIVVVVLTFIFKAVGVSNGQDETVAADYAL